MSALAATVNILQRRLKYFSFCLLFVFIYVISGPLLFSQNNTGGELHLTEEVPLAPAAGSGPITSIEVIGLKRTKPHIAKLPLEKFLGREASSLDPNEVQAAVKDTGILEPLEVGFVESSDGIILRVTVLEKWTVFPVPLVIAGSGGSNFGFFLLDSNAFGLRDAAVLGGMYGTSGVSAIAMYQHTPNSSGWPGWNSFFMYSRRENKNEDNEEEVHRRYSADQIRVSLGLQYPITGFLASSMSVSFSDISLRKKSDDLNPPGEGARFLSFSPGLSLRSSSWDGYLLSQKSLALGYTFNRAFSGFFWNETYARGVFEQPIIPGFRIVLRSGAVWKSEADPDVDPLFEDGPQRAQVDILPRNFSARNYAGFSGGLEKYLVKFNWGTLSVFGAWQCVFSHGLISGSEFDNGPSGGIRLYLSRLALPALGTGLAYNMNSKLYQFTFSMGMEI